MAEYKDTITHFKGLQTGNQALKSCIGDAFDSFNGWSATSSFNPLRSLSPTESSAPVIARAVATLLMDLYKDPS
jgi:hypothetical protein